MDAAREFQIERDNAYALAGLMGNEIEDIRRRILALEHPTRRDTDSIRRDLESVCQARLRMVTDALWRAGNAIDPPARRTLYVVDHGSLRSVPTGAAPAVALAHACSGPSSIIMLEASRQGVPFEIVSMPGAADIRRVLSAVRDGDELIATGGVLV
jgi:hypothetical protein